MAPVLNGNELISIKNQPETITVLGVTPEYATVRNIVVQSGRFLTAAEESGAAKVCVISKELALKMYGTLDIGEEWLRIFGLQFRIVGVYREGVESAAALQKSEAAGLVAIIPFSTFRNLSGVRFVDVVYFQAASPESVPSVVTAASQVIASRHRSLSSFKIESLDQYLVLVQRISDAVSLGPDRHRRGVAAGRRHRHHEHHAGDGHRAHPGHRHPPRPRRRPPRHPHPVPASRPASSAWPAASPAP